MPNQITRQPWQAVNLPGQIGPQAAEAVPALAGTLKDRRENARSSAAYALGQIGPQAAKAVPALAAALKDPEENVRRRAVYALGSIGPKAAEAVPALLATSLQTPTDLFGNSLPWRLVRSTRMPPRSCRPSRPH